MIKLDFSKLGSKIKANLVTRTSILVACIVISFLFTFPFFLDNSSLKFYLEEKVSKKWVFISCKFYSNDDTKTIKDYDIQDILAVINENKHKYKSYEIMLLVNNKEKVNSIISSCQNTNSYIKDNIGTILDINDLEYYFQILKSSIKNLNFTQINSVFCNEKISLQLKKTNRYNVFYIKNINSLWQKKQLPKLLIILLFQMIFKIKIK